MKRNRELNINTITYILFILCTITTIFIVYKKIDNSFTFRFVIGYVIFLFLYCFYMFFSIVLNMRKLKWVQIRKRLIIFIALFALFGTSNYILDYFFRPSKVDLFREFSISFGLSMGITFCDLMFFKKNRK